jgi:hypothetical protein
MAYEAGEGMTEKHTVITLADAVGGFRSHKPSVSDVVICADDPLYITFHLRETGITDKTGGSDFPGNAPLQAAEIPFREAPGCLAKVEECGMS